MTQLAPKVIIKPAFALICRERAFRPPLAMRLPAHGLWSIPILETPLEGENATQAGPACREGF